MFSAVFVIVILLGALLFATVVGAVILRAAVAGYNKLAGRRDAPPAEPTPSAGNSAPQTAPGQAHSGSAQNPYASPAAAGVPAAPLAAEGGHPVREPSMGKAMGICAVRTIVNSVVGFLLGSLLVASQPVAQVARSNAGLLRTWSENPLLMIVSTVLGYVIGSLILAGMLPTRLKHAFLISLIEQVIYLLIGAFILGIVFAATGGTMRL